MWGRNYDIEKANLNKVIEKNLKNVQAYISLGSLKMIKKILSSYALR
jgi:hypothetical protein